MSQTTTDRVRWTTSDIDLLANDEGKRYEIVDGELFVTRAPHWRHQKTCLNIGTELELGASHFCNKYKYSNAKLSFFMY